MNPIDLGSQEGPHRGGLETPAEEHATLLGFVAWERVPPFLEEGRSAFVKRRVISTINETRIAAFKLKGVGNKDVKTGTVSPPSDAPYRRRMMVKGDDRNPQSRLVKELPQILIHRGIADDGTFRPVLDPEKPIGGLSSGKGRQEFENARVLHAARVPVCAPVTWGRYAKLTWRDEPMEWVILSQPTTDPRRISSMFEPKVVGERVVINDDLREAVRKRFGIDDPARETRLSLRVIKDIAFKQGRTLRKAHEAGVLRFAGHMGNWSYMPMESEVFMHDFDSSVKANSIHKNARAMSFIRDIESLIIGMATSLGHSRLLYAMEDEGIFRKFSPIETVLKGYFENDPRTERLVEAVSRLLTEKLIKWLRQMRIDTAPAMQMQWLSQLSFVFSQDIIDGLFDIFPHSELGTENALPFDKTRLRQSFERFGRESEKVSRRRIEELKSELPQWAINMLGL